MADGRFVARWKSGAAAGVLAAALVICAYTGGALAQADQAALNERLFAAVRKNDMASVRSVLTQGADPVARDATGQTPAGLAVDQGYFEIAHYILSVRNQQAAQRQRDVETIAREGPGSAAAPAPPPRAAAPAQSVREPPTPSWRGTAPIAGQATEIPSARITPPREAVVIAPADTKRGTAAKSSPATAPAAKSAIASVRSTPAATPAPAAAPQPPQFSNLPRLPSGAPNPFDPQLPAQPTLPVITATGTPQPSAAPAPAPQGAAAPLRVAPGAATPQAPPETTRPPNPFGRIWNSLTDWFSYDMPRRRGIEVAQAATGAVSDIPTEPLIIDTTALGRWFSRSETAADETEAGLLARLLAALRVEPSRGPIEPIPEPRQPEPVPLETAAAAPQPEPSRDSTPGALARFFSALRIEPAGAPVEPAPARRAMADVAPPPETNEPSALARLFTTLRIEPATAPVEPFPAPERAEHAAAAPEPAPAATPPEAAPVASQEPSALARFFAALRIEPAAAPLEPLPARAAPVPTPTAPQPERAADAPPADEPGLFARLVAALRVQPATGPAREETATEPDELPAAPAVRLPDGPLPLPIVADPTFLPRPTVPAMIEDPPPPKPRAAPTAAEIIAAAEPAPRPGWFTTFLRGLARPQAAEAVPAPAPARGDKKREHEIAALDAMGGGREAAGPRPSVAPPPPATGPLAIEDFALARTQGDAAARERNCFQKGRQPGWYCIEAIDWPPEIGEEMEVDSLLFSRGRAVIHYNNLGVAQSLYTIFPTEHFNRVVRFLESKLGPATSDTNRRMALIGEPAKLNLITSWTRGEDGSVRPAMLEVRKFDTVRSMVPDQRHGLISLSREGATPIFRYVSEADLKMLSMRIESEGAAEREAGRSARPGSGAKR